MPNEELECRITVNQVDQFNFLLLTFPLNLYNLRNIKLDVIRVINVH